MGKWLNRVLSEGKLGCPDVGAVHRSAGARRTASVAKIVTALAAGALLGAVAAMPYDQLLGMSEPACAILRSVVTTVVWAGLGSERLQELIFDPKTLLATSCTHERKHFGE
jgi:hypothetical protein